MTLASPIHVKGIYTSFHEVAYNNQLTVFQQVKPYEQTYNLKNNYVLLHLFFLGTQMMYKNMPTICKIEKSQNPCGLFDRFS